MFLVNRGGKNRWAGSLARLVIALTIGAGVASLPTITVEAQMRVRAGGGMPGMGAGITSRQVDKFGEMLSLSEEQKLAIKTLHDSYLSDRSVETKAMEDLMKNAQSDFMESQDMGVWKEVGEKVKVHQEKIEKIETGFMDDVKSLLDAKQAEKWPKVERQRRRDKLMVSMGPMGLSGENVNLLTIVDDLKLESRTPELDEAIEQYELALDRALVTRDDKRQELQKKSEEQMKDFDPSKMDFSAIRKMMEEMRKSGVPVRDINERHARLVAAALPADKKADFESRVRKGTYTQVYKEPHAGKAITAAMGFSDLTDEQKNTVAALKESYSRDLAAANERWANAIADEEKDGSGDPFGGFGAFIPGGGGGGDKPSPVQEAKKARTELDKATLGRLKEALTPAQIERLPEREADNPWANFGGGGGSDADEGGSKEKPATGRRGRKD